MRVLLMVVLGVLLVEGVSWVVTALLGRVFDIRPPNRAKFLSEQSRMLDRLITEVGRRGTIDSALGWTYGRDFASETEHLNSQGLRARREYAPHAPPGTPRIAVFGDSYVYGNEVSDAETWPSQIEHGWRAEVLNYGVGGYGLDQAFLRYQHEGAALAPSTVVMGITPMMAARVVSRYRRFQDPREGPWFKPRFLLDGDELRLVPTPVATRADAERLIGAPAAVTEFGAHDFWYVPAVFESPFYPWSATYRMLAYAGSRFWRRTFDRDRIRRGMSLNEHSESFDIMLRIMHSFADAVRAAGARPIVLMVPVRSEIEMFEQLGRTSYEGLKRRIEQLGMSTIDPVAALAAASRDGSSLFAPGGHFAARGNAIIARAVAEPLDLVRRDEHTRTRGAPSALPSISTTGSDGR